MTINQRIKNLRKDMKLNQKEFGAKINLGQGAVSRLEQEGVLVIDQNIRLICDTFHVNEDWLRNGQGPREAVDIPKNLLDQVRDEYHLNHVEDQIMRMYLKLPEDARQTISDYVKELAKAIVEDAKPVAEPQITLTVSPEDYKLFQEIKAEEAEQQASASGNTAKEAKEIS